MSPMGNEVNEVNQPHGFDELNEFNEANDPHGFDELNELNEPNELNESNGFTQ